MITLPPTNQMDEESFHPHVRFQWILEGKAYALTLTASTREAVDVYTECNIAAMSQWPEGHLFFALQDFSHPDVLITPYFRKRVEDVVAEIQRVKVKGYSIVALANNLTGNFIRMYGGVFGRKADPIKQHWVVGREASETALAKLVQQHTE